jgi:hypothetical protein
MELLGASLWIATLPACGGSTVVEGYAGPGDVAVDAGTDGEAPKGPGAVDGGVPIDAASEESSEVVRPPACGSWASAASKAESTRGLDPTCTGVDPFVAALEPCSACSFAGATVVIGNHGGREISPGLELSLTLDGTPQAPFVLQEAVPAGGLTKPIDCYRNWFGGELEVSVQLPDDCNSADNRGTVLLQALACQ